MYTRSFENELYHHGVKGMKWGIRKKREPATDKQLSDYRKKKIAESKPASAYPKATRAQYSTKGYWKNMSKADLRRHYDKERRETERVERNKKRKDAIDRGKRYVRDVVDGFKEGWREGIEEAKRQQAEIQYISANNAFMNQQLQFNRQQGSYTLSSGTNPFIFG